MILNSRSSDNKSYAKARARAAKFLWYFLLGSLTLIVFATSKKAHADPKAVEKSRKFYKEHNLDFFGDLVTDQIDAASDEKRHAKIELLADDARTRALDQLEKLLRTSRGTPMEGELLIRKASLLADRAKTAAYFQNNTVKSSKLKAPQVYLEQSISAYLSVESRFPSHPMMDIVLFSIAYNYDELKGSKIDLAYKYYGKVVSKFPDSGLVGDARLAMAEILFGKRDFKGSVAQLKEIVKMDHPRLKNFALYKMAWSYYNLSDLDSAVMSLEKVIEGVNQASSVQRSRLELRKEALHDLVSFYAEKSDVEMARHAPEYFDRVGKTPAAILEDNAVSKAKRMAAYKEKKVETPPEDLEEFQLTEPNELLLRLTSVYKDQGKHEQALAIAEQVIGRIGRHPKVVALYRLKAESAEKLRRRELVVQELQKLAKLIEADLPVVSKFESSLPLLSHEDVQKYMKERGLDSKGDKAIEVKYPQLAEVEATGKEIQAKKDEHEFYRKNLVEIGLSTLKDFSGFFHGEWSKAQNSDTAKFALAAYDAAVHALLTPWRGHDINDCFEIVFRRAQLHLAMTSQARAGESPTIHFEKAAEDFHWLVLRVGEKTPPKQDHTLDNSIKGEIGALEAWHKLSGVVPEAKAQKSKIEERLLVAYDAFIALNSRDPKKVAKVVNSSALLLRDMGKAEPALDRMIYYTLNLHGEPDAQNLVKDVLALYNKTSRWEELQAYSRGLTDKKFFASSAIVKDISQAYEFSSLKLIEHFEAGKDWKKASDAFSEFGQRNPDSPFLSQALLKAANAAFQMKDTLLAVSRLEDATKAKEKETRLQAWLGLEPYYRQAFWWKKLEVLYSKVVELGEKKGQENLKTVAALDHKLFLAKGAELLTPDPDVAVLEKSMVEFQKTLEPFSKMRFVKSNNNPGDNFKKKAKLHEQLVGATDKFVKNSPKSLRGAAAVWAILVKIDLLLEFAETLETAAMPAVLATATDVDKKAYTETVFNNAKELRAQAGNLVGEAMKLASETDSPLPLEKRMNELAEKIGVIGQVERPDFAKVWADFPDRSFKAASRSPAELVKSSDKLGRSLIEAKEKSETAEMREIGYKLAKLYAESGEYGYAYATAGQVLAEKSGDEWGMKAARLQQELNFDRLPASYSAHAKAGTLSAQERWDLARFLAGAAKDCGKKAFSENECKWFDEALQALLRTKQAGGKSKLSAN